MTTPLDPNSMPSEVLECHLCKLHDIPLSCRSMWVIPTSQNRYIRAYHVIPIMLLRVNRKNESNSKHSNSVTYESKDAHSCGIHDLISHLELGSLSSSFVFPVLNIVRLVILFAFSFVSTVSSYFEPVVAKIIQNYTYRNKSEKTRRVFVLHLTM